MGLCSVLISSSTAPQKIGAATCCRVTRAHWCGFIPTSSIRTEPDRSPLPDSGALTMYAASRRVTVQPARSVLRWTLASLVAIACGAPPTEPVSVRLTTERLEYAATDSVALQVTNLASQGYIGYGACPSYTIDERS